MQMKQTPTSFVRQYAPGPVITVRLPSGRSVRPIKSSVNMCESAGVGKWPSRVESQNGTASEGSI